MKTIDQIYINGQFVRPHGTEVMQLINPATGQPATKVTLADARDVQDAVAAAKIAYKTFSQTTREQRIDYLQRMHQAAVARSDELQAMMMEEYGGPVSVSLRITSRAIQLFQDVIKLLKTYEFERQVGTAKVIMSPLGVVGLITPWNANYIFICSKLSMAIAAGNTVVIKPSELSAAQTQILTECLHAAGLPPGVFNIVTGRGDPVGTAITAHPDIAKISFTGSTAVGKTIARGAVDTMKRVTLELGGKSPNVILDDADLDQAMPIAALAMSMNNGQACIAGTRLIVPESRLEEVKHLIKQAVEALKVGDPQDGKTNIGPLITQKQFDRVQGYIRKGIEEGAQLLTGGEGKPAGLESGYFVKPTVFINVTNDMTIAREEIFGPVLCVITYKTEEEAIAIANDTVYGLQAFVSSGNLERANRVASQIVAGTVFINGLYSEPEAPFGGFKQSGIGRELGTYGLEAYLEPKAIMGHGNVNDGRRT